uniref:hypothetical protein n=1 Tax=Yoonia sp. TaxID=2212373 RepID=UPI0040473FA6
MTQTTNTQSSDTPKAQGGCCCGTSSQPATDKVQRDTSPPVAQGVKANTAESDQPRGCCGGK